MEYFFIFGNHPSLALAELIAVLGNSKALLSFNSGAFLTIEKDIGLEKLVNQLGGVVKAGVVVGEFSEDQLENKILGELLEVEKKVFFGVSNYVNSSLSMRGLGLEIKKELKARGKPARFVTSKSAILSSVIVKTNKLLNENGREFVLLQGEGNKITLGVTNVVQDFESFSNRDYGRPERSMESIGLMPPKLARMMVNLAGLIPGETLLDPFCGAGTILQETLLSGSNVIGSDISEESIKATENNLNWLTSNYKLQVTDYKLQKCDATKLSEAVKNKIDAIVTEPYLGPIRGKGDAGAVIRELSQLYLDSFKEFKTVLKPGGRVVMIWPVFRSPSSSRAKRSGVERYHNLKGSHGEISPRGRNDNKDDLIFLPILEQVEKLGFKKIIPSNKRGGPVQRARGVFPDITSRGSFLYSRPDQKVLREIWAFERI